MNNETMQDLFDLDVREVVAEGETEQTTGASDSCRPFCI